MATAALVLAAGGARRMGRPKQLLRWGDHSLLEEVVAAVQAWPVTGLVVVLGASAEEILGEADLEGTTVVVNPEWEEGMASSLRVGLDVLTRDRQWDRTFIAMGDQPRVPPDVPPALLAAMEESGRPAAIPVYRFQRANPVLVARRLWPRFMGLEGDTGANRMLQAHPGWVQEVRFEGLAPFDVDTPEDLEHLPPGG